MRIATPSVLLIPLILLGVLLIPAPAYAACNPFTLNTVAPSSGVGGDSVTLTGTGFCGSTERYFAWGWDGDRGFAFDLVGGTPDTSLSGVLRSTPVAVIGPVRLWRVQEVQLADRALQLPNGVYWLRDIRLSLFRDEAVGPAFKALPSTGAGHTSQLVQGNLQIDFGSNSSGTHLRALTEKDLTVSPAPGEGDHISIMVVVETDGDEPKNSDPDPQDNSGPFRWKLQFEAICFGAAPGCDDSLIDITEGSLNELLSPLNMKATVAGPVLTLGHTDYEMSSGMLSVTPEF